MKNSNHKKATIDDVALSAGVSKSTVSRYINGKTNLMSKETRDRIAKVISSLDYHPLDVARNLKLSKSNTVGVIIADIQSPFSASVISGIEETLNANGYTPLFMSCDNKTDREMAAIFSLVYKKVDGLIINAVNNVNNNLISIAEDGLPVVLCDRDVENYNFNLVTVNNRDLLTKAVKHLKDKGYTKLAYFTETIGTNTVRIERTEEFKNAYSRVFNNKSGEVYEYEGDKDAENKLNSFIKSVKKNEIPAIICINSSCTLAVYRAIKKAGLKVPEQIGIIGPDDWQLKGLDKWTELFEAPVTTLRFSSREMGKKCAELLVSKIDNPDSDPETIYIKSELVERESTNRKKAKTSNKK